MAERAISYTALEHKADTGYLVEAPSLERLYIDAALALTDLLVKLPLIVEVEKRTIAVKNESRDALLVHWLNEVLSLFANQKFLAKRIVFTKFDGKQLSATLYGEAYVPVRHGHASEIKAVISQQLQVGMRSEPEHTFYARIFLET